MSRLYDRYFWHLMGALFVVAIVLLVSVSGGDDMSLRGRTPDRPAVVTVDIGRYPLAPGETIDVEPPQRLDIRFGQLNPDDATLAAAEQACLDMGGQPWWGSAANLTCVDVDY